MHELDRTSGFRELGGNTALALSSAFLKAFAAEEGVELWEYAARIKPKGKAKSGKGRDKANTGSADLQMPKPLCNVAGGWHRKDIQEFLLLPVHQDSFMQSAEKITEAYKEVAEKLKKADRGFAYGKNIESAWVTSLNSEQLLELLKEVADARLLKIGIDVAASQLWDGENYVYDFGNGRVEKMNRPEHVAFLADLAERYPISYIEDPFHEDDFLGFGVLNQSIGGKGKLVCGDDLYATNLERLREGIKHKATNAVIVKPNQVGTVTDTMNFVTEAQEHGWRTVMSHRSGETEDTLVCSLAVGLGCDFVKFGISGDRVAKINEMIRIEEKIKEGV